MENLWREAEQGELCSIDEYRTFCDMGIGTKLLYENTVTHLCRMARLVSDGKLTEHPPQSSVPALFDS